MTPDEAATRRVADVLRWLRSQADEHDRAAAQLGPQYPSGHDALVRAAELRRVAGQIARKFT
jgi:hypothetical protein